MPTSATRAYCERLRRAAAAPAVGLSEAEAERVVTICVEYGTICNGAGSCGSIEDLWRTGAEVLDAE